MSCMKSYRARGECENRIKEAQLDLFADRLSAATFRANQLRLWHALAAYVLMHALRRIGLPGTTLARACANTIRPRLLKIGAVVTLSVRRVKLAMSEACTSQREFIAAFHALSAAARVLPQEPATPTRPPSRSRSATACASPKKPSRSPATPAGVSAPSSYPTFQHLPSCEKWRLARNARRNAPLPERTRRLPRCNER